MLLTLIDCKPPSEPGESPNTPNTNRTPTATLTAPASMDARKPGVFDATLSTDADGDRLSYDWNFGDGTRASSERVAHAYAVAGTYTATLRVFDGRGGEASASQQITVAAPPSATGEATISVEVSARGTAIAGAAVRCLDNQAVAYTNSAGIAALRVGVGAVQRLRVEAEGYARQTRVLDLAASVTTGDLKVGLAPLGTPRTITNVEKGADVDVDLGGRVSFPAQAFVDSEGKSVTGSIEARVSSVDVVNDTAAFPGRFEGYDSNAASGLLLSWGTADFSFTQNGLPLNLKPGTRAVVDIPLWSGLAADGSLIKEGDVFPLWSLDEQTGVWVQEGTGVVTVSPSAPAGFVLRAEVGHFSWWNHDKFDDRYDGDGECCIDSNFDGECDGPTICYVRGRTNCAGSICSGAREATAPPAWMGEDVIASGQRRTLVMPAAYPIELEGFADNGTKVGRMVLTGAPGAKVPFTLVLKPAQQAPQGPSGLLITLPHDTNYAVGSTGTAAAFLFDAPANAVIVLSVERAAGSFLEGQVRLYPPNQTTPSATASFGQNEALLTRTFTAGRWRLEVESTLNTPASYRLFAKVVGSAPTVLGVAPSAGATLVATNAQISVGFSSAIKAASVNASSFKVSSTLGTISGTYGVMGPTAIFTPSTTLPAGTPVRVQLTTAIQNTLNAALVRDYTWSFVTEESLGTQMQLATSGAVAASMHASGQLMVAYTTGTPVELRLATYTPNVGIERVDVLAAPTGPTIQYTPLSIATNATGDLAVLWIEQTLPPTMYHLMCKRFIAGLGWQDTEDVVSMANYLQYAHLAVDDTRRVLVTYSDSMDPNNGWSTRFTPGAGWASPVEFDGGIKVGDFFFSSNGNGDAVVAWRETYNAYAAVLDGDTEVWSAPTDLGNAQGNVKRVAIDESGAAYVNWVDGLDNVFIQRRPKGLPWNGAHQLPGANASYCTPAMAVSPGGSVMVAACSRPATDYVPFVERWAGGVFAGSGNTWNGPSQINSDTMGAEVHLTSLGGDSFELVWQQGGTTVNWSTYAAGAWTGVPSASGSTAFISSFGQSSKTYGDAAVGLIVNTLGSIRLLRYR